MEMAMDNTTHKSALAMKSKLILAFCIILFISNSCNSIKSYQKKNKTCDFESSLFKIDKTDLTLDISKYQSKLEQEKSFVEKTQEGYVNKISVLGSKNIISDVVDEEKGILKSLRYDSIGKIKDITFLYRNGNTPIHKEIIFKNGKVTKTINLEKGYSICWAEAISIIKNIARKDIKKYKIDTFFLNRVNINEFPNENPKWIVAMVGEIEGEYIDKRYEIDGVTGNLIRTYRVNVIHDTLD